MNLDVGVGERRLADYMRRVGEIQQRAERTQAELRTLRARVSSPDRGVSVEMAPGGRLERLTISPEAMRYGPEQLAAMITETVRGGHAAVAEQMRRTLQPLIGDSPAMEFLRDQLEVAQQEEPADPDEAPEPPREHPDDESFESVWEDER